MFLPPLPVTHHDLILLPLSVTYQDLILPPLSVTHPDLILPPFSYSPRSDLTSLVSDLVTHPDLSVCHPEGESVPGCLSSTVAGQH